MAAVGELDDFWYKASLIGWGRSVSERVRRTKMVFDAAAALGAAGRTSFRPGDVTARLRANSTPYGAWEVHRELANLERLGLVVLDEEVATWRLVEGASFSIDAASAACERAWFHDAGRG